MTAGRPMARAADCAPVVSPGAALVERDGAPNPAVALVTGASSGIGAATARTLAAAGYHVVMVARRADVLAGIADGIRAAGATASVLAMDLACDEGPERVVAQTVQQVGTPEVLVNCAGVVRYQQVHELRPRHWDLMFRLNVTAPFLIIRAVLPHMRSQRSGTIVNIGSAVAMSTVGHTAGYAASKRALNALTESVALENREHGVRAVALCPGWVHTPLSPPPDSLGATPDELLSADDVAAAVLWVVTRPPHMSVGPVVPLGPTSPHADMAQAIDRLSRMTEAPSG
ncbi:SDR family NAD(P)-dependent oxidoreductase [Phytoactinopolyspora limicola]|uniref:SDR family NAD(P)-dependent oxidoreductase n=1 Tax=Phytoactinopolyspora limicola TaxID=2715536 RepID=UPI00140B900D|nr:SDR family oxidoreductase [Phytoactinopolyspora limicola]